MRLCDHGNVIGARNDLNLYAGFGFERLIHVKRVVAFSENLYLLGLVPDIDDSRYKPISGV
jgi:hypothetical protein